MVTPLFISSFVQNTNTHNPLYSLVKFFLPIMKSLFYSMVLCLSFLFFLAHISDAAISCGTVNMDAIACVPFVTGKDSKPSTPCCNGLQQLAQGVKSLDDKKAICRCLEAAVKNFPGVQDKYLSQLPDACKIAVGFPVSLSTNCETIN